MSDPEQLARSLSEFSDLNFESDSLYWVFQLFKVDSAFVGQGMEEVIVLNRPLLVPKDKVDPEM